MPSRTLASIPLWLALPLAALAGGILDLGFPDQNLWLLAPVGVALMLVALIGRGPWTGLLTGLVAGLSFWLIHISWLTLYLGPVPWLALAGLQAIFFGISLSLIAVVLTRGPRLLSSAPWPAKLSRLGIVPVVVAGLWTAREGISAVWPYGGFAWGRLALSQSESPFASLVTWLGLSGLSFVLVWLVAFGVQLAREILASPLPGRSAARGVTVVAGLALVLMIVPSFPIVQSGTTRLAAVQGASDAGLFADYEPGQILSDHTSATLPLVGEDVDFVVWPENGSDIDPLVNEQAARVADYVSREMDAPLITGTITERDGLLYNSSLLWKAGEGAESIYDKVHPVPFAEYMPHRDFWRPFAPDLVDLVSRDYEIGTRSNVFDINGVLAGIAICFDIADDQLVKEMIDGKAGIILAQTNNADFGRTDESVQQLAIARLRALETGRTVVNISTVGSSAIITADGETLDSLPTWEPGAMVQTVPLSETITPAMAFGRWIEWVGSFLGVAGFLLCLVLPRVRRRKA